MSVLPSNTSNASTDQQRRLGHRLRPERSLEAVLRVLAVVAMLLDVVLTDYGLTMGLSEVSPIGRMALSALESLGLLLAKLPVLALALAGRRLLPATERWAVPLGRVIPRGAAVVLNLSLLLRSCDQGVTDGAGPARDTVSLSRRPRTTDRRWCFRRRKKKREPTVVRYGSGDAAVAVLAVPLLPVIVVVIVRRRCRRR